MNRYINSLKSFLAQQTLNFGYDDFDSILKMLHYYYTVANPIDNAVIRCQLKELNDILCRLTLKENDAVFDLVTALCATHEQQAFNDGVCVGMRLFSELNDLTD